MRILNLVTSRSVVILEGRFIRDRSEIYVKIRLELKGIMS